MRGGRSGYDLATLSPEQQAICNHVWDSPDRVILIRGAAGTGKTHTMTATIAGIDRPVAVLAPSADASRGVLRREGFHDADTVAAFLNSRERQRAVHNGVIWVDEAGLLAIRDLSRLTDVAREQNARLVLQGDPRQHRSIPRDGNMFQVLQQFAGLPVAELKDIRRQRGKYKEAVALIDKGEILKAHDLLDDLGMIRQVPVWDHNKPLVDDYLAATGAGKSVLVVAPTHAEGDEITAEIRARLKKEGKIGDEERDFEQLRPLGFTDAEKGDMSRFDGTETIQWFRNGGSFRAGQRLRVAEWSADRRLGQPSGYGVYASGSIGIAIGDTIRVTANGKDATGKHRLDNGSQYVVAGFTDGGDIRLHNGWVIAKDFGHLTHGYVSTSFGAQGKTVDVVLAAMGHESLPAMNVRQFYVDASRGRERVTIYTDLAAQQLREQIQRDDNRKSATELMRKPKRKKTIRERTQALMKRVKETYERLRNGAADAMRDMARTQERELYAR